MWLGFGAARAANEFTINADTPWVVAARQPEAVERALEDVKRDWYKVLGHTPVVLNAPPENWSGPIIYLGLGGTWLEPLVDEPFPGPESFLLRVRRDDANRPILLATGADMRGAIYAAYALSEEILGVDPWYFWTDNEPARRKSISLPADFDKRFGPPTFKYRGWFINDEDLLAGHSPDPLRENPFSLAIADRIYETLLRLRGNMVVPATWIFPDEQLNQLATRRGLILSFHHIQVVGLNTHRWPRDVPFSFQRHPEIMEDYWRRCIEYLKDKEVVWTVGYRGRGDRAFWTDEEGLDTDEERGAAISQAIARQVQLIREVQPDAPIISNLWREGADLWHAGHIKLPPGVTLVWADCGAGTMDDQGRVQAGQGIYYHTAMFDRTANQVSEMVNPERIYREIGRFIQAGATEYFLVNVSDVRPVPLSTDCVMKLVWNAEPYLERSDKENMDAFILEWCRRQYGDEVAEAAATLYMKYFNIPYHRPPLRYGDRWTHRRMFDLHEAALPLIPAGEPLSEEILSRIKDTLKIIEENHAHVADLTARAEALAPSVAAARRDFYRSHLVAQSKIHLLSLDMKRAYCRALEAYSAGDKTRARSYTDEAFVAVNGILETMREGEYGKWAGWYYGELFVGYYASRDRLRVLSAVLRDQEIPPTRSIVRTRSMFGYQGPFLENFPLLYPAQHRQETGLKPAVHGSSAQAMNHSPSAEPASPPPPASEDGYDLWLRYGEIAAADARKQYRQQIRGVLVQGESPTLRLAREELVVGLTGLLGQDVPVLASVSGDGVLIAGTPRGSPLIARLIPEAQLRKAGDEGYLIRSARIDGRRCIVIAANEEIGVLYGAFHFLRLIQTHQTIGELDLTSAPRIRRRILNHWDNLGGTVTRGYAGRSLWKWDELPETIDSRMIDYARANASLGLNGTVLNSVNTDAASLSEKYLKKTAALADAFRPYGIRVYLSARFSAPMEIGGLDTADPLDPRVKAWWQDKASEIYGLIPDFGGFVVKADSEGQPGPHNYNRTHADGANMLARAVARHGGIVMWRAFVYRHPAPRGQARAIPSGPNGIAAMDMTRHSYLSFKPLDGQFDSNVLVQVKNGPLDFLPREPVHPLFGAMPRTPLMMELQITQEYLGHSKFLVYLAPLWKESLEFDTYAKGQGSTVARVVDGTLDDQRISGIAGVANTGTDRNWCGHHFAQANWYAFGRLAWDHGLDSRAIADEWARMTFSSEPFVIETIVSMMMDSREIAVDTMTPLGLSVLCEYRGHYRPAPEVRGAFHKAAAQGLGYNRSRSGSGAADQYHPPINDLFNDSATCPEKYLLWFHHLPWDHTMASGRTLWDELCLRYAAGVEGAVRLRQSWNGLRGRIDEQRFAEVAAKLEVQERDAVQWRDTCVSYFQQFSGRPIPTEPAKQERNQDLP